MTACFCYFFFVTPIAFANLFPHRSHENPERIAILYLVLLCLYWLQYSANFFIYAARCDQYRKAYVYFLQCCKNYFFGAPEWKTSTATIMIMNRNMVIPDIIQDCSPNQVSELKITFHVNCIGALGCFDFSEIKCFEFCHLILDLALFFKNIAKPFCTMSSRI